MTRITSPLLLCFLLALSLALGSLAAGRAAGFAAVEATLTEVVICAGGEGEKTVLVSHDGTPTELPHCAQMLCDACLQAGAQALLTDPFHHDAPRVTATRQERSGADLHHPSMIRSTQSRAPPVVAVTPRKIL